VRLVLGSEEMVVTLFLAVFSVGVGAGLDAVAIHPARQDQRPDGAVGMLGLALFRSICGPPAPAPVGRAA
jgi:hypothetical protein